MLKIGNCEKNEHGEQIENGEKSAKGANSENIDN